MWVYDEDVGALISLDFNPAPRVTKTNHLREHRAAIIVFVAVALVILGFPPSVPSDGSVEIEFDKSSYIVGDRVNANIYLSNVNPWPIRVQPYNKFEISREFNGESYGPVDGAHITWGWGASIYIPPYSRVVVHQDYSFKVDNAGEYKVMIELNTGNKGSQSVMVYT
ncbi:hypothetical protein A3K69_08340 [Candidatus Bathyarchaeota archaeon RBG_16_57_9]|jgi:hypothetical protein|nr:MAG: hypothetical protein A3K69_08340 [Candidatus Bathyarchaeota archaeon RBG_16_57_9]